MLTHQILFRARTLRGWSQSTMASKLGTSPKNVSRWERGNTFPSPYFRERLCQLFDLDAEALGLLPPSQILPSTMTTLSVSDNGLQFIGQEALLQNLLHQVQPGSSLTLTGLPGVGKTALLGKLLQLPPLQKRFSDGIIWVRLGPTPNLRYQLTRVARLLGFPTEALEQEDSEADRVHLLLQFLGDAMVTRRLLLVLDDVWAVEDALPFLVGGSSVAYVLTTRLPKIAFTLASQEPYIVPPLSFEASYHLLTTLVPHIETIDATLLRKVIMLTGGLPLAIVLIGKYLAPYSYGGQSRRLELALKQLIDPEYLLQLSSPLLPINVPHTQIAVQSLENTIALSIHHLPADAQMAMRALSVLPSAPEHFTEETALSVTGAKQEVLELLIDNGLIELTENRCYQIHRIIADYARYRLKEQAPQIRLLRYEEQVDMPRLSTAR